MPLHTARISRERTIATLARNVFAIEPNAAPAEVKAAEDALLRANPHLADRENWGVGVIVLVPSDVPFRKTDRVAKPDEGLRGLLQEAADRLDLGLALAGGSLRAEQTEAKAYLEHLGSRSFRRAVTAQFGDGERFLKTAEETQSRRAESAEARAQALAAAVAAAHEELKLLMAQASTP